MNVEVLQHLVFYFTITVLGIWHATFSTHHSLSSNLFLFIQGIPKQELIDIDLGQHFHLEIVFDTTKFEFRIKYNDGDMEPYVVPTADYYFSNATIHGNLNITYMGFPYIGELG